MEQTKSEVSFFIRASDPNVNIDQLLNEVGFTSARAETWRKGEPINARKNYSNSGVIFKLFEGNFDDITVALTSTIIPVLEQKRVELKSLKAKVKTMIFEIELNILKDKKHFLLALSLPNKLISIITDIGLDVDITEYFLD